MTLADRLRRLAGACALATGAGLLLPGVGVAQTPLPLSTWTPFAWFDGVGPISDPGDGFRLSLATLGRVRLTDAFGSGDAFDLWVDGVLALSTPAVTPGVETGASDAAAWADPALSKGELVLGAGDHLLDIRVRLDAGFGYGDGWVRADPVTSGVVPEPATLALVATGLAGLAAGARRRARHAAPPDRGVRPPR